jgi:nucleotide-binding universal stress UspA family protein
MRTATASTADVRSAAAVATNGGFHHLLVCLDRSETAEAVLPLASCLARVDGARLTLLHVLEVMGDEGRATDALEWDVVREEARSYLERLAERMRELGIETDGRVAEGPAPRSVAALAAEIHADLLVLSTYGVGGRLLGSP